MLSQNLSFFFFTCSDSDFFLLLFVHSNKSRLLLASKWQGCLCKTFASGYHKAGSCFPPKVQVLISSVRCIDPRSARCFLNTEAFCVGLFQRLGFDLRGCWTGGICWKNKCQLPCLLSAEWKAVKGSAPSCSQKRW